MEGIHIWDMGYRRWRLATTRHCKIWAGYAPLHCEKGTDYIGVSTALEMGKEVPPPGGVYLFLLLSCLICVSAEQSEASMSVVYITTKGGEVDEGGCRYLYRHHGWCVERRNRSLGA